MSEKTANYGLTKPLPEEFYDVTVQNTNMDIIDEQLKVLSETQVTGNITTYNSIEQLGLNSNEFVSDNFLSNLSKIADKMGDGNFNIQLMISNTSASRLYNSIVKKINTDMAISIPSTDIFNVFIEGQFGTEYHTGSMMVEINSTSYTYVGKVFSCVFLRGLMDDAVSGMVFTGVHTHDASDITGSLQIANGGTGATTASDALVNLGAMPLKGKSSTISTYPEKEGFYRVASGTLFKNMTPDSPYGLLIMFGAIYKLHMFISSQGSLYWGYTDNYTEPSEWHEAGDVSKLLPLEGGTLTGDLKIEKSFPRLELKDSKSARGLDFLAIDDYVEIVNRLDDTNSRGIRIKPETEDVESSVYIDEYVNGLHKSYQLFGEHNKPSGIYVGAGNTTEKRIAIGAKVTSVIIQSNNGMAIVGLKGTMYSEITGAIKWTNNAYIDKATNEIVLKTNDVALNANGVVYDWKSL